MQPYRDSCSPAARNSRFMERPYTDFPVVGVLTGLQGAIPTQQPV